MSPVIVWSIIFALVVVFAFYATRMARQSDDDSKHDTGLAIIEFGRAFPDEAIRSLHWTADSKTVFVRLHDNKAGFMRNKGNHYACVLIEPGRVRVTGSANAKGFAVEFLDSPSQNGVFVFENEKDAAEVSLWLLDNYVTVEDRQAESEAPAP